MGTATKSMVACSVSRLAAWAPGVSTAEDWDAWARGERTIGGDDVPPLREMPAMLRRHAGPLGRMACEVAYRVLDGASSVPMVYASRHGDAARSVELLTDLAERAPLSPTSFSLSVHNAVAGLFSIARHDRANIVALSAGEASAAHGVIEACGLLAEGAPEVLLVVVETAIPPVYHAFDDIHSLPFAWAWLVTAAQDAPVELTWEHVPGAHAAPARLPEPAALDVLRFFLRGDRELVHEAASHRWRWSRRA